jgi:NO-binding membrane sensor protein with MHYT domain
MNFYVLIGLAVVVWVACVVACMVAIRWSRAPEFPRFWPAAALCFAVLVVGYLGMTQVRLQMSRTVNGQDAWNLDSRWPYGALIPLGAAALGVTLWRGGRRPAGGSQPAP